MPLINDSTMALFFCNRGHDKITSVKKLNRSVKGYEMELAGGAHELFTDCVDDIQGAIDLLVQKRGRRNISCWAFNWLSEINILP